MEKLKPMIWSAVGGAVLGAILLMTTGFYMSKSTAAELTEAATKNVTTCVAAGSTDAENLEALRAETSVYTQRRIIEKANWVKLGDDVHEKVEDAIQEACAKILIAG